MRVLMTIALLAGCLATLEAQDRLPPPFPRPNATLLMENERIRVWDIVWPKGQPTALHRHIYDQVGTYYAPGGRIITTPEGVARTTETAVGALSTTRKGTTHIEAGNSEPPLRAVFIELKRDTPSGAPSAVASPGLPTTKQVHDDERVAVWDVAQWSPGAPPFRPSHETVIVWLGTGTMRVTGGEGGSSAVPVTPGTVRHLPASAAGSIEMADGAPRAMIFELK